MCGQNIVNVTPDGVTISVAEWGNPAGPEILFIPGQAQTVVSFKRQTGSQLLILGQDERGAVGLLSGAVVSLAAQHPAGAAKFFFLAANFDVEPVSFAEALRRARAEDENDGEG